MAQRDTFLQTETSPIKGISFPAIHGTGGLFTQSPGAAAILAGLKQLLLTNQGERVMLPEYGTNIRKHLFEPDDIQTRTQIQREVEAAISRWEPRISLRNISVTQDTRADRADYSALKIRLEFTIVDYPYEVQELTLIL